MKDKMENDNRVISIKVEDNTIEYVENYPKVHCDLNII